MPAGYEHFQGDQAPRYQYILDDEDSGFTPGASWKVAHFDTGQWKSAGRFYHHCSAQCRTLDGTGSAEWKLRIPADGTYTLEAWWAAAPEQPSWTRQAVYEVVAAGTVVASGALDQSPARRSMAQDSDRCPTCVPIIPSCAIRKRRLVRATIGCRQRHSRLVGGAAG